MCDIYKMFLNESLGERKKDDFVKNQSIILRIYILLVVFKLLNFQSIIRGYKMQLFGSARHPI